MFVAIGPNAWGKHSIALEAVKLCKQNFSKPHDSTKPCIVLKFTNDPKCSISEIDGSIEYHLEVDGDKGFVETIGYLNYSGRFVEGPRDGQHV
jgi:hypothetical protein